MSIGPGSRFGTYEVAELIGEGGMGAVYRAHDSRLARDVAVKVIRVGLAADPERVARFDREARLLASLSHPHVATIHGLEQVGDSRVLVLELVVGPTLAERLREGPLPTRDALAFGMQIAAAIEAAHEKGIIHRDLKPANIKLTPSGVVKVLDFGLAKALAADSSFGAISGSPTFTSGGTAEGVILGTAAYMSPEQARGKEVDKRTDVWAFGCVLYDMLTGKNAFAGDTLSDTLAAILTREPDWDQLPPDVPSPIRRLLRRCLQKDAHRRLRDIGDAKLELEEALGTSGDDRAPASTASAGLVPTTSPLRHVWLLLAGALLVAAALGAGIYALFRSGGATETRPVAQFTHPLPENERLAGLDFPAVAISPTETHIAYVAARGGRQQIFVRPLASLEAQPLAGTEGALSPFFSPDGKWIAFFASGKLHKIPVGGGTVRPIADAEIGFGGVWAPDNTIVFAPNNASELLRVNADGGTPDPITSLDRSRGEFSHRWPDLLPDGRSILFAAGTEGSWDDAEVVVQRIGSSERRTVVYGGTSPRFAASGHLLYTRGGVLHALPFDPGTARAVGEARALPELVMQSIDGAAQMHVSRAGSLFFVPGSAAMAGRTLTWVDRSGNPQPLAAPPRAYASPRVSPDGRSLVVSIDGEPGQVWRYDISSNQLTQLTFDGGALPVWSADGKRVFFASSRGGPPHLFSRPATSGGVDERLTRGARAHMPHAETPDGGLLFVESDPAGRDISLLSPDGSIRPVLATHANESAPAVSPDGRWLAYVSDISGQAEVYVAPLGDLSRSIQVSRSGGTEPMWRRDGQELFFRSGQRMLAVTVRTSPAVSAQAPRELFSGSFESGVASRPGYDVSPDGTRFLMVRAADLNPPGRELRIVLGWRPAR